MKAYDLLEFIKLQYVSNLIMKNIFNYLYRVKRNVVHKSYDIRSGFNYVMYSYMKLRAYKCTAREGI